MALECERIHSLTLCADRECHAMYANIKNLSPDELLPCGHKIGTVHFSGTTFKFDAEAESRLMDIETDIAQIKVAIRRL